MPNRYKSGFRKRQRWSRNAVLAKERIRIDRANSPQAEINLIGIRKIKTARFSVKINMERTDGERIQFTCHRIGHSIYHNGKLIAPKSFFRRIGEIAELWSRE